MIGRPLTWPRRVWLRTTHRLFMPVYRLSRRFPHYEIGHSSLEINRIECRHPALTGRRAVHLTDLHVDYDHPRHDVLVGTVAELQPDWIFVTGDLLNVPEGLPHLFGLLSRLRQVAPTFVTLGNHDHWSGVPVDQFAEWADRHKLSLLINQVTSVPLANGELRIVGLDDPSLHRADLRILPRHDCRQFTVVLAHAPNVVDHLQEHHAADLVLCGHSHGGQWQVPWVRPFWLPYGCNGRIHGHFVHQGRQLYVSRGLGWSILPARFSCPPELLIVDWTS